ncbi:MAG: DUF3467 domain-containing protein [Candidatus Margulisbacteria bacterium]|nr:DUF3467 domain-containing protein [Candidatus Margulisiibacteriota bacterium]
MEEQKIPIEIDNQTAGGIYSNVAVISHTENEFTFDFIYVHPPKGKVNARVITSPSHAKRLLKALQSNIEMFEKNFGPIKEAPEPPKFGMELSKN